MKYNPYMFKIRVLVHQLLRVKVQKHLELLENESITVCMNRQKKLKHLMVELRVANRLNHFSHFFLSSTSPNCMYFACCRKMHLFFLPSFTQWSLPSGSLGSCGASLSFLLAVSAGQAESSCIPHCLWFGKPPCHKLLEMWEGILRKFHCFELFYFFFPASSVTAG